MAQQQNQNNKSQAPQAKDSDSPSPAADSKSKKLQKKEASRPVLSSIRTYASDVASVLKREKTSVSEIALAEKDRRKREKVLSPREQKKSKRSFTFGLLALVLALGGAAALGLSVFFLRDRVVEPKFQIPSLIFANALEEIPTDGVENGLVEIINGKIHSVTESLGSIVNLYLTEQTPEFKRLITAQEFLLKTESSAGPVFSRALDKEFMLGAHIFNGNEGFLIFKIDSFENAFAQMLNWEDKMPDEVFNLFYKEVPNISLEDEEGEEILGVNRVFEDLVVENRDTRALRDSTGEITLIYSFPNRNTLIITTNINTLNEIFSRLTTTRFRN